MIPQLFSPTSFVLEGFQTQCSFNYIDRDLYTRLFIILMFAFGLLLPLSIIIIFYLRIWFFLKKNQTFIYFYSLKSNKKSNDKSTNEYHQNETNEMTSEVIPLNDLKKMTIKVLNSAGRAKLIRNEMKLLKSVILNITMFCVAWFPYAIVTLLAQFGPTKNIQNYINPFSTSLPGIFAKLSSVYNPFIFINLNKKCRIYIKKIMHF